MFRHDALRLLADRNATITFVDVGSRNGILELASIASFVDAYGFEPNPVEHEKLLTGETDSSLLGVRSPKYRSVTYCPHAIADVVGRKSLYITRGPGSSGLLEPDFDRLREIHWRDMVRIPNWAEALIVERVEDVVVTTLEAFACEQHLSAIDYLKLDVEGSAYEVLIGAGEDLLRRIGVIKAELEFIPYRKGQKLFSHVDLFLREHGFDLLRYEISPAQIGFKERTSGWSFGPIIGIPERYGQPLQCDAIYVNRAIDDPDRALAQAAVLLEKNYLDEALFILRTRAHVNDHTLLNAIREYRGNWRQRAATWVVESGLLLLDAMQRAQRRITAARNRRELARRGIQLP